MLSLVATLALLAPCAAFAHTDLFLGVNLGGLFPPVYTPPPAVVYTPAPPVYYAPAPRVYYAPRRVYYGYGWHERRWHDRDDWREHGRWHHDHDRHGHHGWHH